MFQAFLDDSGSGAPVFVLSGYVSPVDWWDDFSSKWQELLDEKPRLRYFKMNEAAQLSGEFARMNAKTRNERIKKFLSLIWKASHQSVSCVIPINPYNRIIKARIKKAWDDPYFIALFDVVTTLLDGLISMKVSGNLDKDSVLDFIFDDNPRLAAKVPRWYQLTRACLDPEIRNSIAVDARFENDRDYFPLQAADAQSWYYRRIFAERLSNQPFKADLPKELFRELDTIPAVMLFWSSERMEYFVEDANNPPSKVNRKPHKRFKDIHDVIANADLD